jgi:hypothetical protein
MKWLMIVIVLVTATAQAEIYRWCDGRGTMHYTNREDEIPTRYRSQAKVVDLGLPIAPVPGAAPAEMPASQSGAAIPAPPQQIPPVSTTINNSRPVQAKPLATRQARQRREKTAGDD